MNEVRKKTFHWIFIASHLHYAITGYKHNEIIIDELSLSITKQSEAHIFQIYFRDTPISTTKFIFWKLVCCLVALNFYIANAELP